MSGVIKPDTLSLSKGQMAAINLRKYSLPVFVLLLFTHCGGFGEGPRSSKETEAHLWSYQKKFTNFYTVKDDIKIGEYYMNLQIKEFKKSGYGVDLPKHQALKSRIERIVNRLAAVSDIPTLPYEVHIFDRPDIVNAFCMPGGKIGVFTGLFDKEKGLITEASDDEIAAVIGHEMAHATLRHITRMLTRLQTWSFLGSVASSALYQGVGAQAQYIFNQVFSLGTNLYLPSYSRKYEKAADQAGFFYLSRAKYNPQAAIDVWKRAAARGGPNSKKTDFFASHPASGERAKALERWLPEAQAMTRGEFPVESQSN